LIKKIIKFFIGGKNSIQLKINVNRTIRFLKYQRFASQQNTEMKVFSDPTSQVFFGYYDITPFNSDESKLLATQVPFTFSTPGANTTMSIGYYSLESSSPKFQEIASTKTWCWQQGCRLQWYPDSSNQLILYNTLVDGKYACLIQDIISRKIIKRYEYPLYTVSQDGKWGLSLNFSRLQRLRPGYGYSNVSDRTVGISSPEDDGIWRIDLKTGESQLLISTKKITEILPHEIMGYVENYFNHISFNPSGTRFSFFHLWNIPTNRGASLLTADVDGDNLAILNDIGDFSHITWKSDDELIVCGGEHYELYRDRTSVRKIIGESILTKDGHPTLISGNNWILSDTYPDKYGDQTLLLFNLETNELKHIEKFYSSAGFRGEVRCDLHPRISPTGKFACVDSAHNGKREMFVIPLNQWLN
jgi:hypothetical protein